MLVLPPRLKNMIRNAKVNNAFYLVQSSQVESSRVCLVRLVGFVEERPIVIGLIYFTEIVARLDV